MIALPTVITPMETTPASSNWIHNGMASAATTGGVQSSWPRSAAASQPVIIAAVRASARSTYRPPTRRCSSASKASSSSTRRSAARPAHARTVENCSRLRGPRAASRRLATGYLYYSYDCHRVRPRAWRRPVGHRHRPCPRGQGLGLAWAAERWQRDSHADNTVISGLSGPSMATREPPGRGQGYASGLG